MKIEHDFHIHTHLSYCADKSALICDYIKKAKENGLKKIGISNHIWDRNIKREGNPKGVEFYEAQTFEHIFKEKEEITNAQNACSLSKMFSKISVLTIRDLE